MDKVVHFELPADNIDRAKKFYKETFGWNFDDWPDYTSIETTEVTHNDITTRTIRGNMFKRGEAENIINGPTLSVLVLDIDHAIKKIKNAGGLILKDKTQIGNIGFSASFKDTEGNILNIWQPMNKQ